MIDNNSLRAIVQMYRCLGPYERQTLVYGATRELVGTSVLPMSGYPYYDAELFTHRSSRLASQQESLVVRVDVSYSQI